MIFYFGGREEGHAPEAVCGHASIMASFYDFHTGIVRLEGSGERCERMQRLFKRDKTRKLINRKPK